jgi:hypothetical protein
MSVKIVSKNKKKITLEVSIDLDNENFLQTEGLIMDKVNELGQKVTEETLKNLEIKETVIVVKEQKLYAKNRKKNIKHHTEK